MSIIKFNFWKKALLQVRNAYFRANARQKIGNGRKRVIMDKRKAVYHPREKVIQQASWLTSGTFSSCLLGAIIIIPWYAWMGDQGNIATSYLDMSYTWFAVFELAATAGLPSILAQQAEKHNAMNEYKTTQHLFIRCFQLSLGLGVLTAGLMFLLAPLLASISGGGPDLAAVFRSMSLALVIFPVMRVLQGYFQGMQDLFSLGLSRLIFQALQALFMLVSSFFVLQVFQGSIKTAVIQSVFAAFVAALGGFLILLLCWQKDQEHLEILAMRSLDKVESSISVILWEGFLEALPYVLLGSGFFIYKLVDQLTFIPFMAAHTNYSQQQLFNLYGIFRANPDRITLPVVAAAGALLLRYLPSLMERVVKKQSGEVVRFISIHLQRFIFVLLPVVFWLLLNARAIYTLFYGASILGTHVLIISLVASFLAGFGLVTAFLLQSLQQEKAALYYWLAGLALKLLIQLPLIELLEVYGPHLATILGLALTGALSYRKIKKTTKSKYRLAFRRFLLIAVLALISWLLTLVIQQVSYRWLNPDSRLPALLVCLITGLFNTSLYLYVTLKIRLADRLLGAKAKRWRQTLRIK